MQQNTEEIRCLGRIVRVEGIQVSIQTDSGPEQFGIDHSGLLRRGDWVTYRLLDCVAVELKKEGSQT